MPRIAVDISALRASRDLRYLISGDVAASLGTQAVLVAVPFQVYALSGSAALVGLTGLAELVPLVAASLLAGAWADRFDRRTVLLGAQALVAALAGALAAAAFTGPPPVALVMTLAALLAGAGSIVNVTATAAVPVLAGPAHLRSAVALTFGIGTAAGIVGPGIAGLVIAGAGVGAVYAADAVGFVVMFAATLLIRPLPPDAGAAAETMGRSIATGLRFVRGNRPLLGSFAIDLMAMTFGMPRALFAVLALDVYHAGAAGTGALYAAVSAGACVGALTTGWVERIRHLGRIVIAAVGVWGLAIAGAGLMPSLWPAAALLALAGAADSVSAVCRSIINQLATPEAMRGRMSSVFMLVVTSGPRFGDLESGVAASLFSAGAAVVSGGLICVAGLGAIALLFPELAAYEAEPATAPR